LNDAVQTISLIALLSFAAAAHAGDDDVLSDPQLLDAASPAWILTAGAEVDVDGGYLADGSVAFVPRENTTFTLHAGYARDATLQYFSHYRLHAADKSLACFALPYTQLHYAALPRVIIVREDRGFAAVSYCVNQSKLIQRDEIALGSLPSRRCAYEANGHNIGGMDGADGSGLGADGTAQARPGAQETGHAGRYVDGRG